MSRIPESNLEMQLDQPTSVHSFQCVQTLAMLSQLCPSIKDQRIFHGLTTTLEILPLGPLYSLESICHAKNLLIHKTVGSYHMPDFATLEWAAALSTSSSYNSWPPSLFSFRHIHPRVFSNGLGPFHSFHTTPYPSWLQSVTTMTCASSTQHKAFSTLFMA